MSFEAIRKSNAHAAKLLQLFSFMNPDLILTDFLVSGARGIEDNLREVVSDMTKLAKALCELEKFSLIKWNRSAKTLSIHRLVQIVVRDEMSSEAKESLMNTIVEISYCAFPRKVTNDTRALCRRYRSQVMPLLQFKGIETLRIAEVMETVSKFLLSDGSNKEAERFCMLGQNVRAAI